MKRNALAILLLPLLIFMHAISPLFLIRIGGIRANRIGHLALDLELCTSLEEEKSSIFPIHIKLFYLVTPISNYYLESLWRRKLKIFPKIFLEPIDISIRKFRFLHQHNYFNFISLYGHSDLTILDKYPPRLLLPEDDVTTGECLLNKLGISTGQKYVCLAVRDGRYLNEFLPETDWSYHDFRDSDIQDYLEMAEYLTKKGLVVIRMGKLMQQKFETNNPMIIDYANSNLRSDFADVYLFANCFFCISTSTGMDALASIFRKPIGLVNVVNIKSVAKGEIIKLFQPKCFFDTRLGRNLNYEEIMTRGLFSISDSFNLSTNNVVLKNNTPEELMLFANDFLGVLSKRKIHQSENGDYKLDPNSCHGRIGKISQSWLNRHSDYLNSNGS